MARDAFPADLTAAYDMGERLASGGFGAVYRARHRKLGREAAVKVLHADAQADPAHVQRFVAEARLAAQLECPHVVRVLDYGMGDDGQSPWIAYAYASGPSVAQMLEGGALPVARATAIGAQVARALAAAHARGIVHRDVKPGNVLEIAPGHVVLCDFGIALWNDEMRVKTATGVILGTPQYLAPEVIQGQPASPASDVYALGVMLHEMLTGRVPFEQENLAQVLKAHLELPPPDLRRACPQAGAPLASAVARALAKKPEQRFESAEAFAEALEPADAPRAKAPVKRSAPTAVVSRAAPDRPGARTPWVGLAVGIVLGLLIPRGPWQVEPPLVAAPPASVTPSPSLAPSASATPRASLPPWVAPPRTAGRTKPSFTAPVNALVDQAMVFHHAGAHTVELKKLVHSLKRLEANPTALKGDRDSLLEQWIWLRDLVLQCRAEPQETTQVILEIQDDPDHDSMEREAFQLTLVRPGLAPALDRAQVRIDSVAPLGATTMGWIADLERDEEPAMLQRDWTALRVTYPVQLHEDLVQGPAVLFNLRRLLDPGWGPGNRPALDQLVRMAVRWIRESPVALENGLRAKTPAPEFLRGLSHRIQLTRMLAHRIVGRGFPWSVQFDLMRGARHVLVLARRRLNHRVAALTADLEAAQSRPGCEWMRLWRHARQLHDKGMCSEEALGYARALRAFEDQEELQAKSLNRIDPDTLSAWLRLRGDISVIPDATHLHTDSAKEAQGELDKSWLPEAKLPDKLEAIMRRAGWGVHSK